MDEEITYTIVATGDAELDAMQSINRVMVGWDLTDEMRRRIATWAYDRWGVKENQ